jgi:hypothetical protein
MTTPLEPQQSDLDEWLESLMQDCVECIKESGGNRFYEELSFLAKVEEIIKNFEGNDFPPLMVETLCAIVELQKCRTDGDADGAIKKAILLGELLHQADFFDEHRAGMRAVEAGQKAAKATWGTDEQRQAELTNRRSLFEEERPRFSNDRQAYEAVARRCGVNWRTIRRAVTGH